MEPGGLLPQTEVMAIPNESRQNSLPLEPLERTKAKKKSQKARRIWTTFEIQLLLAYLQWSVESGVNFEKVAIPRLIKVMNYSVKPKQVLRKLNYYWGCKARGGVKYTEMLKIGRDAFELDPTTREEVDKLLADIPNLDTEPHTAIEAKGQEVKRTIIPKDEEVYIIHAPEEPCQIEVACDSPHNNEQLTTAESPACTPSDHAEATQQRRMVTIHLTNKRKISELESQLFSSQNETAELKRRLKELPNCAPDVEALNTYRGYHQASLNQSSREKTFDINNPGMTEDDISCAYTALFEQIQSVCEYVVELDGAMPGADASFSELAKLWAYQTFKKDLQCCIKDVHGKVLCEEELLAGLLAAAVIDGVFEPTFPRVLEASWPTSNPYRNYILNSHGVIALHIADRMVLPELVSDRKSDIIGKEVENLHQLFSKSLDVFWHSQDRHITQNDDNDVDIVAPPKLPPDLRQFLRSALDLKYKLTSSTTRLRYLYFQPQVPFDEKRMVRCKGSNPDCWMIKFCIFPVLLYAPSRPADASSNDYILEHNALYNMYFTKIETENPLGLVVAAKAIVLT
ncbi:hypothetical protein FHETE_2458 [Fusarium heterosporum]|uniref:Uncharacterized protein n=1 Tax=Fusarium heterosporum TaxID=42747 RepID=A0A8H5TUQ0_FUSHE|nr:hypothetical protein FHETE_2458 [Fusarium heterosporum]